VNRPDGRLFLVRHGEAAASWGQDADPPLSERGRDQARVAADLLQAKLAGVEPLLVSSPLRRAQETAAPLCDRLHAPVAIDERFREIPAPVPLPERQGWLRDFMGQRWSEQDDDLLAWRQGILAALEQVPAGAVVYTHFLVINAVVGILQQRDETLCFWPGNASITVLERKAGVLGLQELGEQMASRIN
jgi:broad specificity phosphatase PhoE